MKHTSKTCTTCLKLCDLHVPVKIDDKRKAVLEHKQNCLNSKLIKSSDLKIEHLVRTSYTLMAQLKTCNEENIENLNMCYKKCLYELHHLDQKLKTMSNEKKRN